MTLIRIDPNELGAAHQTLMSAATELAGIAPQIRSCAQCPLPVEFREIADQAAARIDRVFNELATYLSLIATDLHQRAVIAVLEPLVSTQNPMLAHPDVIALAGAPVAGGFPAMGGLTGAVSGTGATVPWGWDPAIPMQANSQTRSPTFDASLARAQDIVNTSQHNTGSIWFSRSDEEIFARVAQERGRPVTFLTQADRDYHNPRPSYTPPRMSASQINLLAQQGDGRAAIDAARAQMFTGLHSGFFT